MYAFIVLLDFRPRPHDSDMPLLFSQANPKLAKLRDDDDRLPIHWAASYNRLPIVEILADRKDFDPDVQVRSSFYVQDISGRSSSDKTNNRTAQAGPPS